MNIEIKEIDQHNRTLINDFIVKNWFDTKMIITSEIVELSNSDGYCVIEEESVQGVITYRIDNNECEITLLHSLIENKHIGSQLVEKVVNISKKKGINKIRVVTTNDNIKAIAFYQKRGFDLSKIYLNSMEYVRKLKPNVPLIGENNIPLKHEIEFQLII